MLKHFDTFSGYGGFSIACERHGIETIGFSEVNKYASGVLKFRWPNIKNYGDIKKIDWAQVPDFDILTGGSPCQDLSIAGKRSGLGGDRSGLFHEFMRAVRQKAPKYFIWENVKGALSSQNGWDFAVVLREMADAGYSLWWQVYNAKWSNIPQNRERIVVVGFRDGSPREVFFEPGGGGENLREITTGVSDAQRIYDALGLAKSQKALGGWMGAKTGLYFVVPEATKAGVAIAVPGDSINLSNLNSKTRRGRVGNQIAQTLTTSAEQYVLHGGRVRRLMPIECERLMGLPDNWTATGDIFGWMGIGQSRDKLSDTQRYQLCGNGVVVNMVEDILKHIIL